MISTASRCVCTVNRRVRGVALMISLAALALTAGGLSAQQPAATVNRVTGRVTKPAKDGPVGVANVWVTLHRVGQDSAGPIDSVRTNAQGQYRISYRSFGAADAVYFAASLYHGIAYFSMPLGRGTGAATPADAAAGGGTSARDTSDTHDEGEEGDITVFDTTSSNAVPLTVRGRHLVVGTPDKNGDRKVTEVFEISNDSFVTKVAVGDTPAGASWSAQLPANAQQPAVLEGDLPAAAVKFVNDRILVYAPFAPGLKQVAYTYVLKSDAFPFSLPIEHAVSVLEVLAEESNTRVSGARLQQVAPATIEGRNFRRYLASDAPANAVVSVEVTEVEKSIDPLFVALLTLLIGGTMVGALVWAMRRRR